jgi:hypothetical protein
VASGVVSRSASCLEPPGSCWLLLAAAGSWQRLQPAGPGPAVAVTATTPSPVCPRCPWPQGGYSQFPGVLVGPPPLRKCHQMSSKGQHMQLGWVVRWVLSTPPGHPAAGWCGRVVPVLPLLLCTRPARACPSVGVKAPLPLRASSRGVPPRGPNTLSVSSANHPRLFIKTAVASLRGSK